MMKKRLFQEESPTPTPKSSPFASPTKNQRQKWLTSGSHPQKNFYKEADQLFWKTFWVEFRNHLVQDMLSLQLLEPGEEAVDCFNNLHQVALLESLKNLGAACGELSEDATQAIDAVFRQLQRLISEKKWSFFHRKMMKDMDNFLSWF